MQHDSSRLHVTVEYATAILMVSICSKYTLDLMTRKSIKCLGLVKRYINSYHIRSMLCNFYIFSCLAFCLQIQTVIIRIRPYGFCTQHPLNLKQDSKFKVSTKGAPMKLFIDNVQLFFSRFNQLLLQIGPTKIRFACQTITCNFFISRMRFFRV